MRWCRWSSWTAPRSPNFLRRRGRWTSAGREIAGQLLAGLEAIHAAGFVHRDLKPENVMLTLSKRVVVMDFGIARSLTETQAGTIAGTPGYMSPEQAAGLPVDARADVFSAAVVLAEMCRRGRSERRISERQTQAVGGAAPGPPSGFGRTLESGAPPGTEPFTWGPLFLRGCAGARLEIEQRETSRADQSPTRVFCISHERTPASSSAASSKWSRCSVSCDALACER